MLGYRKWSVAILALGLGFIAALFGKLTPELASLIGGVAGSFFAANGYTTGRGGETPQASSSTSDVK